MTRATGCVYVGNKGLILELSQFSILRKVDKILNCVPKHSTYTKITATVLKTIEQWLFLSMLPIKTKFRTSEQSIQFIYENKNLGKN